MWSKLSLFFLLILSVVAQSPDELPLVNISQGVVIGSVASDGEYFEFHGIPYADSTSGAHRFKAPLPAPSFQEDFVANRRNVKCVHALGTGYEGTEDCLVVDIYTPTLDNTQNLPVVVWVKGKEFDRNSDYQLSFKNFVEKEVVVVSLNFRESILGFLCLGTETAPGNAGLKDIIAGLVWVKENIAEFGGNPENINLFGHGSGAAAVDLVTLSPMANGLVHKAVAQSGTAMAPWAVTRNNLKYAIAVAEALGHTITDIESLSQIFTRTSVAALMAVINELDLTDNALAFAPCIENPDLEESVPFLIDTPYNILRVGDYLQIPFMTGFVDNEGTIRSEEATEWIQKMDSTFNEFLQSDLAFDTAEQEELVTEEIKTYYFGDGSIGTSSEDIEDFLSYQGDTMILVSAIREARLRATTATEVPVYLYQFSYKGSLGEPFVGPVEVPSAAHSGELPFLFHQDIDDETLTLDFAVSDNIIERWTNFVKTGVPSSETSAIEWLPFTSENTAFIRFLDEDEIIEAEDVTLDSALVDPHPQKVLFWELLYQQYYLDAFSTFDLSIRDDEDDDEIEVVEGEEGSGDEEIEGSGDEDEENSTDGEDNGLPDSASTAVGYTFSVLTLFAILSKFHDSQILS